MKQFTLKELTRMNIGTQRKLLRDLNKEARARAKRLKKAGFTGEMTEPPTVDYQRTPREELIRRIEDLQMYTRNKLSRVSGMKKFQRETLATLHGHGYDFVDKNNLADFGRFMNMVRDLHGSKAFPSNEVANMYKNMERLNISPNVIKTKFADYLTSQAGINDLSMTLDTMRLPENRARISSTEVMDKMKELGFM